MSVKRKFRKSKKTKGKTKNNNKHKNNEKRSKIQRKTKKRVLRGGKGQYEKVSSTRGWWARRTRNEEITQDECKELQKNIQDVKSKGNTPALTEHALRDEYNCLNNYSINVLNVATGSDAPPPSERSSLSEGDESVDFRSAVIKSADEEAKPVVATTGQLGAEAKLDSGSDSGDLVARVEQEDTGDSATPGVEKENEQVVTDYSVAAAPPAGEAAEASPVVEAAPVPAEKTNTETPPAGEVAEASPVAEAAEAAAEETNTATPPAGEAALQKPKAEREAEAERERVAIIYINVTK
jgi:hypothetical protein